MPLHQDKQKAKMGAQVNRFTVFADLSISQDNPGMRRIIHRDFVDLPYAALVT